MTSRIHKTVYCFFPLCVLFAVLLAPLSLLAQQAAGAKSCDQYLAPQVEINGKRVGQESCRMTETDATYLGRKYRRIDMGISGTLPGYTLREEHADSSRYANYFNVYPEFVFPPDKLRVPAAHGIGRYKMEEGSSLTVIYPLEQNAWNGKMFVTAHGTGLSFRRGNLKPWDQNLDPADPLDERKLGVYGRTISKYERLMLEKGYSVAKTRRSMTGDIPVTLDDGTVVQDRNLAEQPPHILGFAKVAANLLRERLGRPPRRTYWYGHSAGARPGRMVNYKAGLNVDADGTPMIDGILADDAGAGLWLPVVMQDGRDILFTTEAERQRFVPMIEIGHLLYVNERPDDPPTWHGDRNFLANKRQNAKLLREKGLWHKFRYYEVDGVSHNGGEYLPGGRREDIHILEMSRLMDGFIDLLDNWVEKGAAPPPSKSAWKELGGVSKDGSAANPPLALPEVACPLGVYHIFPASRGLSGQGVTGFAPFSGEGLEPPDGRGAEPDNASLGFVDMNRNGYRDVVETATEAWQRLGLLKPNERFSRDRYRRCVDRAVSKLQSEKFILPQTAKFYREQARTMPLPVK